MPEENISSSAGRSLGQGVLVSVSELPALWFGNLIKGPRSEWSGSVRSYCQFSLVIGNGVGLKRGVVKFCNHLLTSLPTPQF